MKKLKGDYEVSRVENRRSLYEFAVAKHTDNPAKIEVGRPHDLNPASYEDTKKILREESVKAGISKYGDLGLPLYVMDHHTKISLVCSLFCFFAQVVKNLVVK